MAHKNRIPFVSLLALSAAMPAFAQEGPQSDAKADSGRDVIVITANKREETVNDVAVAVTALTSEAKQELGVITISDLTNVTPGLSYTPSNERITLRGIGRLSNSIGADPGVANYNDGFYTSFAVTAGKDPLLIDRVEVLRGPQGTLYGRNAIGGAINTISKRPTDDFSADVKLGAGDYDYRNVVAAVSGPVTDWLRYRVAGQREVRDGVDYNYGTGEREGWGIDRTILELQLEGDIGDRFNWWFKTVEGNFRQDGPPGGATSSFVTTPYLPNVFNLNGTTSPNNAFAFGPGVTSRTQDGSRTDNPFSTNGEHALNTNFAQLGNVDQQDEYTFEAVYSTDWFDIKYVGGYNYFNYFRDLDSDGTPVESMTYQAITSRITAGGCNLASLGPNNGTSPLTGFPAALLIAGGAGACITGTAPKTIHPGLRDNYGESRAFFSNEINLISTIEGPLQWIVGAYQYQENSNQPGLTVTMDNEPGMDTYFNPTTGTFIANTDRRLIRAANKSFFNAYGLYGQADYSLSDQLKFTLGLRYSKDVKQSHEEIFLGCFIVCNAVNINPTGTAFFPPEFTNFTAIQFRDVFAATQAANGYTASLDSRGYGVRELHGSYDAVTGTAGVEYRPWEDTLTFLKYSRGYKAGGFNNLGFALNPYTKPEFVDSYEAGWKQGWFDGALTTNAALFYYKYTDAQAPLTVITTDPTTLVQSSSSQFINLPEVHTTGFELEANWNPIDNLNVGLTYAYLNAEIQSDDIYLDASRDDRCHSTAAPTVNATCVSTAGPTFANVFNDPLARRSVKGNTLSQSPENKFAANVTYRIDMADGSYFLPTVSYSWRDEFFDSFFNNANQIAPAYENIDARLNWKSADSLLGLTFWVHNLADTDQTASVGSNAFRKDDNGRYQNFNYTTPRMWGVDLQVHY